MLKKIPEKVYFPILLHMAKFPEINKFLAIFPEIRKFPENFYPCVVSGGRRLHIQIQDHDFKTNIMMQYNGEEGKM